MKVSKEYGLCKMRHRTDEGYKKYWHLIIGKETGTSNEYTVCGRAMPDSTLGREDFEVEGYKNGGKITCDDCQKIISWYKNIK